MTAFGFRWYGPEDAVTLEHIRQIPPVTELVTSLYHIPAGALWPEEDIAARAARAAAAGLHFSVAEGLPVHESIKLGGPERERYIGQFVENLERLARHGVHTVCYNFMPLFGWIRTELEQPLPDGSATLAFHQAALERMNPERDVWTLPGWNFSTRQGEIRTLLGQYRALGEAGLWNNLRYFLQAVVPEAERLGIRLAIHPDDPPLPVFGLPRVVSTLEDLLRLTRLDSGAAAEPAPVAVAPVLRRVVRMLAVVAREQETTLSYEADESAVVLATEDDLHQILYNLMENGIKYSGHMGFVHTALTVEGGDVVIRVEDNGVGISDEDMPHIFERFYRVDKARSREVGGTGLGLSIVSDTVRRRGGTVSVAHRPAGQGTLFTVRLPQVTEEGGST